MEIIETSEQSSGRGTLALAIAGNPNVGKSVLFHRLTGHYVTVSNFPGTTVEISRGKARFCADAAVIDTPGIIAFPPRSGDEWATARVLYEEDLDALLHVGDAKNLRRTLLLTVQLAELGLPTVLALNMMDEAASRGIGVDHERLAGRLGIPVVPTVATADEGTDRLGQTLERALTGGVPPAFHLTYPAEIEAAVADLGGLVPAPSVASRALVLAWLAGDRAAEDWLEGHLGEAGLATFRARRDLLQRAFAEPLSTVIQLVRIRFAEEVAGDVSVDSRAGARSLGRRLGRLTSHRVWGWPMLALVLYGLYWFVGKLGAGTLVGLVEEDLFGGLVNPWLHDHLTRAIPWPFLSDLLVGEYGLWTMGMTYALALILPIVTTFFLAFGMLEDSGYFSRLVVLSNRAFRVLGLNGRAVLPMVLGLGCVTMATLTTRILESRRDRLLVTLLLALAVPCSAQLGVVMGMMSIVSVTAVLIWAIVVIAVLLAVGWIGARVLPGERTPLLVELAPMRMPVLGNVIAKTLARLEWYLKEVVPLFLIGTAIMFVLDKAAVLPWLAARGEPLVSGWLGLPAEASGAFLMGFLRRDFGATGLFSMEARGLLTAQQVVVGMVTLTLFVPCIASVFVIIKELRWRTAAGMVALIFPLAFLIGGLVHLGLTAIGWGMS